jgi:hypothetical protein
MENVMIYVILDAGPFRHGCLRSDFTLRHVK